MADLLQAGIQTAGTMFVRGYKPLNSTCAHVCGVHIYAHDITRQIEAHHYCQPGPITGMLQCVIFDRDSSDAKLIGIEYIIPAETYEKLDPTEQKYWHSHVHEVKSGMLYTPEGSLEVDMPHMKHLINTYGKTWHTWQVDKDDLPLGPPQLMMSFTKDGQIDPALLKERDERLGKSTEAVKEARKQLQPKHPVAAAADHWEDSETAWQTTMAETQQIRK